MIASCGNVPAAAREAALLSAVRENAVSTVVALPTNSSALTVGRAAGLFLDSLTNPNTIRGYASDRPLAVVVDDEVGEALESLWGEAAVGAWNARRAAVGSWLAWCRDRGDAPTVPGWCKRLATPDSETPVRSWLAIDRLVARREVALREETLYPLFRAPSTTSEAGGAPTEARSSSSVSPRRSA